MNTHLKLPRKKTMQVYQHARITGVKRNGIAEVPTDPTNTLTSTLTTTHIFQR